MKILIKSQTELMAAARCDIDYHLPPEHLQVFDVGVVKEVSQVADVIKAKRNPTESPDLNFQYIDISSVDVSVGRIVNPQELAGEEAPSRARKIVRANDIIVSTCRPTRGGIALVPEYLDDEICSTGFSVWRAKTKEILPEYLHWALRLESTLEQFRKWSTGSSYPAILDEDVAKTRIPVPSLEQQEKIVQSIVGALIKRDQQINAANEEWESRQEYVLKRVSEMKSSSLSLVK